MILSLVMNMQMIKERMGKGCSITHCEKVFSNLPFLFVM